MQKVYVNIHIQQEMAFTVDLWQENLVNWSGTTLNSTVLLSLKFLPLACNHNLFMAATWILQVFYSAIYYMRLCYILQFPCLSHLLQFNSDAYQGDFQGFQETLLLMDLAQPMFENKRSKYSNRTFTSVFIPRFLLWRGMRNVGCDH